MNQPSPSFGPYILQQRLGVGGMAETFFAVRRGPAGFEQRVCLKRVLPALNADPTFSEQFILEAKIAAMLRHANIVGVIDFGSHEGSYYLALELVDGVDLRILLHAMQGRMPVDLAVVVVHDLARALAYAHEARDGRPGIVHRDISPSNLLVNTDGDVKLADFGIAKAIQSAGATASHMVKGKIQYMAPEQMLGVPVDGRADLFAMGVVLFEMLAGQRPFDGMTDIDTMRRVVDGLRPKLLELAPETPPELAQLVERLLATKPEDRPAHAGLVLDELQSVASGARRRLAGEVQRVRAQSISPPAASVPPLAATVPIPPPARMPSSPPAAGTPAEALVTQTRRGPRRRPWIVLVAALVACVAVGALAWKKQSADQAAESVPTGGPDAPASSRADREIPPVVAPPAATAILHAPDPVPPAPPVAAPEPPAEIAPEAGAKTQREVGRRHSRSPRDKARPGAEPVPVAAAPVAPEASSKGERATVHVVVIPWGEVWVDGRYMGRAPTDVVVEVGEHNLEVGQGKPSRAQHLVLKPGERRAIELELE